MSHCHDKKEQHYFGNAVHFHTISGLCCQQFEECHRSFISYFQWAFKIKKIPPTITLYKGPFLMTPSITFLNGKDALLCSLAIPLLS